MTNETGIQESLPDSAADDIAANALAVVSQELMETIRNAHLALEDCVDGAAARQRCSAVVSCCTRCPAR